MISRPGSEQAKVTDRMTVSVWNMVRQSRNEVVDGVGSHDPSFQSEVLSQKLDLPVCDFDEAMLRDGRTSDVSTGVPQKLCFRSEMSDVNTPPSLVLPR